MTSISEDFVSPLYQFERDMAIAIRESERTAPGARQAQPDPVILDMLSTRDMIESAEAAQRRASNHMSIASVLPVGDDHDCEQQVRKQQRAAQRYAVEAGDDEELREVLRISALEAEAAVPLPLPTTQPPTVTGEIMTEVEQEPFCLPGNTSTHGAGDAPPPRLEPYDVSKEDRLRKRRKQYLKLFACFVGVGCIVIVVVLVFALTGRNSAPAPEVTTLTTDDDDIAAGACRYVDFDSCHRPRGELECVPGHIQAKYYDVLDEIHALSPISLDLDANMFSCKPTNLAVLSLAQTPITTSSSQRASCIVEAFALKVLFYSTNGETWRQAQGWEDNNGANPLWMHCSAYGVECDKQLKVKAIKLNNNNMEGRLPSEMGLLTELEVLEVTTNFLFGTLPTELVSHPTLLRNLVLPENYFSGTIPTQVGSLHQLDRLVLSRNQFTGRVPSELTSCTHIATLGVAYNQYLEGSLVEEGWDDMTVLTELYLAKTAIQFDPTHPICSGRLRDQLEIFDSEALCDVEGPAVLVPNDDMTSAYTPPQVIVPP